MSENKLNREKPYGEVFGLTDARYYQNGKYFNAAGDEVTEDGELVRPSKKSPTIPAGSGAEVTQKGEPVTEAEPADDLESLPWIKLQELVNTAGGTYKNKKQAVEFLRSLKG